MLKRNDLEHHKPTGYLFSLNESDRNTFIFYKNEVKQLHGMRSFIGKFSNLD